MRLPQVEPLSVAYRLLNPGVVVLVTVGDAERDNVFTASWNMPVESDPPTVAVCIGKDHFSYSFVERTGELGLSIPDESLVDAVYGCGSTSGADVPRPRTPEIGRGRTENPHELASSRDGGADNAGRVT